MRITDECYGRPSSVGRFEVTVQPYQRVRDNRRIGSGEAATGNRHSNGKSGAKMAKTRSMHCRDMNTLDGLTQRWVGRNCW